MEQTKFDEILVALVESHDNLYDKTKKSYRDDSQKPNSWISIALNLDSEVEIVKKRWDNLRDRFVRSYRDKTETLPSGSGAPDAKTIDFPFYDIMTWLVPHIRKRRSTTSVPKIIKNPKKKVEHEVIDMLPLEVDAVDRTPFVESDVELLFPRSAVSDNSASNSINSKKHGLQEQLSNVITNFHQLVESHSNMIRNEKKEEVNNADELFMKSVVEDMKFITDSKDKIKFKKDVLTVLEKYIH